MEAIFITGAVVAVIAALFLGYVLGHEAGYLECLNDSELKKHDPCN